MSWLKENGCSLAVGVTCNRYGNDRVLALEPVSLSDLLSPRDQAWWDGVRAGALPPDLQALEVEVHPGENEGPDRLSGYVVEMRKGRQSYRRHFKPSTLSQTLVRPLEKLLTDEVILAEDEYDYFLTSRPHDESDRKRSIGQVQATTRVEPLEFETGSLAEYMANSEEIVGPTSLQLASGERKSKQMPMFVADDVWQDGHDLARLGGEDESAAVPTGRLMRDIDSPEVFVVIDAFLQAEFAEEEKFSVTFSGDTWGKLRARLEQRRRRLNRPQEMIIGSAHGHNFQPAADKSGRRMAEHCVGLSDVALFSGGNDGVNPPNERGTYGNVQIHVRRDGTDWTAPLTKFHPEIRQAEGELPGGPNCGQMAESIPQILFANLGVASAMLNAFFAYTCGRLGYQEVQFDILEARSLPQFPLQGNRIPQPLSAPE